MNVSYLYSVMLGSYDATEGPVLFMVDPSGLSWVGCSDNCGRIQFFLLSYRDTRVWQLGRLNNQPKQSWRN